jgi:hypothetical protein
MRKLLMTAMAFAALATMPPLISTAVAGNAGAPGPAFPEYDIEGNCRANPNVVSRHTSLDNCREFEGSLRHIMKDGDVGAKSYGEIVRDPQWKEIPADLRSYCLSYYMPRQMEFVRNVGGLSAQPSYTWLHSCIDGGRYPKRDPWNWLDADLKSYFGRYANDPGYYYPGWKETN